MSILKIMLALALVLATAAINVALYKNKPETAPILPPSRAAIEIAQTDDFGDLQQTEQFSQTFARPLFSLTRRPFQPVEEEIIVPEIVEEPELSLEEPEPAQAPKLQLLGIQISPSNRAALLKNNADNAVDWFNLNTEIEGWSVSSIEPSFVIISRDGATSQIALENEAPLEISQGDQ